MRRTVYVEPESFNCPRETYGTPITAFVIYFGQREENGSEAGMVPPDRRTVTKNTYCADTHPELEVPECCAQSAVSQYRIRTTVLQSVFPFAERWRNVLRPQIAS